MKQNGILMILLTGLLLAGLLAGSAAGDGWYVPLGERVSGGFDHIQILMSYPYRLSAPGIDPMFTIDENNQYSPIGEQWRTLFIDPNYDFISIRGPNVGYLTTLYFTVWLNGTPAWDRPAMSFQAYRDGIMVDNATIVCHGTGETDWYVSPGTWTIRRPMPAYLPGDADRDGAVNVQDLAILAVHYGRSEMFWANGDFTGDGTVDVRDLAVLATKYGNNSFQYAATPPTVPEPLTGPHVPEPATLLLMGLGAAALLRRRRNAK